MKYIKLILILLFFGSCSTNKSVIGLYGNCEKGDLACRQIELKIDNKFEEYIFYDVGPRGIVRKGTWEKISKDTIVLNTYEQPQILITNYFGKIKSDLKNKVKIRISDKNGPLDFLNISINDRQQVKVTDSNGIVQFDAQSIRNIEYGFLNQIEKINIDNPNYNEIEILIKDLDLSAIPKFIINKKIIIKPNKIIMDTTYVYKKTSLKNKQWE